MRHQVKGRKLNRSTPHRKATLQALSVALIKEQRIKTTLAKAKELRRFVEPLITRAKTDTTHNRRLVFAALQDKHAVTELFEEIGPTASDRPGGYTRVLKLGFRSGDAAEMGLIELVDYNDIKPETKSTKKKRTRRAGKSKKSESSESESEKSTAKKNVADKKKKKEASSKSKSKADTKSKKEEADKAENETKEEK